MDKRITKALDIAASCGPVDGAHHKAWAIDQMVRALTGCPMVEDSAIDCRGDPYTFMRQGESAEYHEFLREFADGEDGPHTYQWELGIAP